MSMGAETILRRRPDVRFRHIRHESVAIRQRAGEVLVLNEFGGRILELLDGSRSIAEVISVLASEFDADRATLEADVHRFAADLEEAGLVEPVAAR